MLDKDKILNFMTRRKDALNDHITRDFGGHMQGRVYEHSEVKYWKEAIERGQFDSVMEVYMIMTLANEPVDFTFYTDEAEVEERVKYLNSISDGAVYWYITLVSNFRNEKKGGESNVFEEND